MQLMAALIDRSERRARIDDYSAAASGTAAIWSVVTLQLEQTKIEKM
jgi:hypothetical protein